MSDKKHSDVVSMLRDALPEDQALYDEVEKQIHRRHVIESVVRDMADILINPAADDKDREMALSTLLDAVSVHSQPATKKDTHVNAYRDAIQEIIWGARQFQDAVPEDERSAPFTESGPLGQIPVSAYCLTLAQRVWEHSGWRERSGLPLGGGAFVGGGGVFPPTQQGNT